MLERALKGSPKYWTWIAFLLVIIGAGFVCYLYQLEHGLGITGMSRDISWGVYIAQFTFLVGVAASAVMLVIPKYLHDYKTFGPVVILGEFLAIAAVTMCLLFIIVDIGQPARVFNVLLHPTPNSILFWDMIVLNGYLFINILVGWTTLGAERNDVPPPAWIKPFVYLSIPWAVSIHTVTAFLYAGLPGRHMWLTAIMAPRFLASAFASGPSLLILLCLLVRRLTKFDPGKEAIQTLSKIVVYAMITNMFFLAMEFFTAYYSGIPGHHHSLDYLFFGLDGKGELVPWMWTAVILGLAGILILLIPPLRRNERILAVAAACIFASTWTDKGVGLVIGGFIPNPFEEVIEYHPTAREITIALAIWAIGALILTALYKIAISIKEEKALG
ncbi:polysulfide reductase NrfD [Dissulfurirhabdus thermomarina]|uniref:Polysulfide reductase NrfD n=1 Tax=Dissulfurirhabdus thermomarina TaxID=1765737 RepID=A0A6N9TUM3_DISTH|nr:NrfD/PsrC family molybdoenzyme membrane anchor subunit [Dissulfurirhabdus thermomarina]NDY43137.1 polysulfide reductase NrfD [Dissulfurirhabdus thermomarina]NMX23995.1 polysulfide reductase NrfD [Dissulfurirhabdus thermomarina]